MYIIRGQRHWGERNVALTRAILMTILRGGFRRVFFFFFLLSRLIVWRWGERKGTLHTRWEWVRERGSERHEWSEMTATRATLDIEFISSIADVRARIYVSLSCSRFVYASLVDTMTNPFGVCDDSIINSRRNFRARERCVSYVKDDSLSDPVECRAPTRLGLCLSERSGRRKAREGKLTRALQTRGGLFSIPKLPRDTLRYLYFNRWQFLV